MQATITRKTTKKPSSATLKADIQDWLTRQGRLPPYHADLSPIELVWGDIKDRVAEPFTECMKEKKELCCKLFSEYPVAKWRKCCEHVYKIEDTYRQRECVIDEAVDRFIISVNNDSSSSDDDDGTGSDGRGDLTSESDSEIAEDPGIAVLRFDQY
ncbi:hypothetical protein J6590_088933 [Homalodisca vitripennis]|nr:hypothetical protein J6590_088933 [Homalodisca vitripennis]